MFAHMNTISDRFFINGPDKKSSRNLSAIYLYGNDNVTVGNPAMCTNNQYQHP